MKLLTTLGASSALALLIAAPLHAQGALVGTEALDDRITDIQDDIDEDIANANDSDRFGTQRYGDGFSGSVSAGFAGTYGNTDTADFSAAGRLRYGNGPWNHTFGFAAEFAEDGGTRNKEEIYAVYDVNRYISDQFYVFGLGSVEYDGFATNEWDAFLGVGPGYRIYNQPDLTWRVQAGPGVRYTKTQAGDENTELAGLAASRLYYKINENMFLTNDTDLLYSDSSSTLTNDFGINFRMTDVLATRVSLRTEYDSDPAPGFERTDNTLGLSLVYGF